MPQLIIHFLTLNVNTNKHIWKYILMEKIHEAQNIYG